jgi:anti-sigma-K factor RskA
VNCDEIEELLGAYALDALPPDEAAAVAAHLAGCPEQAATARELRAASLALQSLPDALPPPPALRSRVLEAVAREPRERAAPAPATSPRDRLTWRTQQSPSNIRRFPTYAWGALAAALVIAIGGLFAWNITLRNRLDDRLDASRATAVAPLQGAGAGGGTVLYFADRHKAVVIGADMPAPDAGKTYQLWAVGDDGQPKSIGLMQPDAAGRTNAVVDFDRDATGTLAITVEPAGGSDQPTSAPVFTAKV